MAGEIQLYRVSDLQTMASAMAKTKMFGFKTQEEAFALMLVAQAEGKHPATIAQDYDVIQGRPALKSVAALSRFQHAGGAIQWHKRTDSEASATFSHKLGGDVTIEWTIKRAQAAQLTGKDNWKKFPAQMLSAPVVAEGVRACFPACLNGFYLAEEVQDFDPKPSAPVRTEKSAKRVEVSQDPPPPELANPGDARDVLADLKALQVPWADVAAVLNGTHPTDMTAEQFAALDQMRHAIQSQQSETTDTTETREF